MQKQNKMVVNMLPTSKLNFNAEWEKLKLVDLLKMYCLQDKTKDRPINFKGSYLEDFYKQVAVDNGFLILVVKRVIITKMF